VGLIRDARAIARKVLETAVSLAYIESDSHRKEERVERFFYHRNIISYGHLLQVQKRPERFSKRINTGFGKIQKDIEQAYEIAKGHFELKNGRVKHTFIQNWDGKTLRDMAAETAMFPEIVTYTLFSDSSHFSSADITTYFDTLNGAILTGLSTEEVPYILIDTLRLAGRVLDIADRHFCLHLSERLLTFGDELNRLSELCSA